jgi:hypothetical protein
MGLEWIGKSSDCCLWRCYYGKEPPADLPLAGSKQGGQVASHLALSITESDGIRTNLSL